MKFLFLALTLIATTANAQIVSTLRILPMKFQDAISDPQSISEIQARFNAFAARVSLTTNALRTINVLVNPYVTVPYEFNSAMQDNGQIVSCAPPTSSWSTIVRGLNSSAGQPIDGTTWVYSPQTFGQCSEADRIGTMVDGRNFPYLFVQTFGMGSAEMPAWTVICTENGNYVTLSGTCINGTRNFISYGGQGESGFTCHDRAKIGTMPVERIKTVLEGAVLPITYKLAPIEEVPSGDEIQCLRINAFRVPISGSSFTIPSITFETHKIPDWPAGLIGTKTGSSNIYDFSPDGKPIWPGYGGNGALVEGASFTYNGVKLSVGNKDSRGVIPVTVSNANEVPPPVDPPPTELPPPTDCSVSANGIFTLSVTVVEAGECITYSRSTVTSAILRHRKGDHPAVTEQVGDGEKVGACVGILHIQSGNGNYYRYNFVAKTWTNLGPSVPCATDAPIVWNTVNGTIENNNTNSDLRICITGQPCIVVRP